MPNSKITLLPGREYPIQQGHHWIFSGAIKSLPRGLNGDIADVYTSHGDYLGYGYFNSVSNISGRILAWDRTPIDTRLRDLITEAYTLRQNLFDSKLTNCYRLINGEGDQFPGLVVDIYDQVAVIQVSTQGIEKLKSKIVKLLQEIVGVKQIWEKSALPSRREEGLTDFVGQLVGPAIETVEVLENGHKFIVNLANSHKTGFYLDQREMRAQVGKLVKQMNIKSLLNCFSYTGGFSVYAAAAGASRVVSVDISKEVVKQAQSNFDTNELSSDKHEFVAQDVFAYLRNAESLPFELVILDPPAFAKKKNDLPQATKAYRDINRIAMSKMPKGSILITSSCSYHMDPESFQKTIFQAAVSAERQVRIISRHLLAADHCFNLRHPEAEYLKSLVLYVE